MDSKSGPSIHLECVSLAEALFCAECEMISNSRSYCRCCGSAAVIPVARVFGGSLRQHKRAARVTAHAELMSCALPAASDTSALSARTPAADFTDKSVEAA